jgi:hypothetical protein
MDAALVDILAEKGQEITGQYVLADLEALGKCTDDSVVMETLQKWAAGDDSLRKRMAGTIIAQAQRTVGSQTHAAIQKLKSKKPLESTDPATMAAAAKLGMPAKPTDERQAMQAEMDAHTHRMARVAQKAALHGASLGAKMAVEKMNAEKGAIRAAGGLAKGVGPGFLSAAGRVITHSDGTFTRLNRHSFDNAPKAPWLGRAAGPKGARIQHAPAPKIQAEATPHDRLSPPATKPAVAKPASRWGRKAKFGVAAAGAGAVGLHQYRRSQDGKFSGSGAAMTKAAPDGAHVGLTPHMTMTPDFHGGSETGGKTSRASNVQDTRDKRQAHATGYRGTMNPTPPIVRGNTPAPGMVDDMEHGTIHGSAEPAGGTKMGTAASLAGVKRSALVMAIGAMRRKATANPIAKMATKPISPSSEPIPRQVRMTPVAAKVHEMSKPPRFARMPSQKSELVKNGERDGL